MKINGIRKHALPFDKLITPFPSLYNILNQQFEGFLEPGTLELITAGNETYILDKTFDTRWIHDFELTEHFLNTYDEIKSDYDRRITRFFTVIAESKNILFVRIRINRNQALQLRDLLSTLYPDKNFLLLALDNTAEITEDWNLEKVKNMYLRQPVPYSWKGDNKAWQEVFESVGVLTQEKN